MKFKTKLWKRSEKSFATTIPHIVLLSLDESKRHNVFWEFNEKLGVWTVAVKQNSTLVSKDGSSSKKISLLNSKKINGDTL